MTLVHVDQQVLVSAVRYALGRQTYIVANTVAEVLRVWADLSPGVQALILRDILDADDRLTAIDREEWQRITNRAAQ